MSVLTVEISHTDHGTWLHVAAGRESHDRRLNGVTEHQVANALRGVDQVLGLNPGPCERWLAGGQPLDTDCGGCDNGECCGACPCCGGDQS